MFGWSLWFVSGLLSDEITDDKVILAKKWLEVSLPTRIRLTMERMPRPTESPLQTFQNCVIVFKMCSKLIPKKPSKKNRTPWPLTSSIPRWNRKCGGTESRRVVRVDTDLFPLKLEGLRIFWVFRFVVRLDWKECRGYSLVVENLEMWISMVFFRWAACDGEQWLDSHHRLGWLKNRVQLSDSAHCYCFFGVNCTRQRSNNFTTANGC